MIIVYACVYICKYFAVLPDSSTCTVNAWLYCFSYALLVSASYLCSSRSFVSYMYVALLYIFVYMYSKSPPLTAPPTHTHRTQEANRSGSFSALSTSRWPWPVRSQQGVCLKRRGRTTLFTSRAGLVSHGLWPSTCPSLPKTGLLHRGLSLIPQLTLRYGNLCSDTYL